MKRLLVPMILLLATAPLPAQDQETVAQQTRIAKQGATVNGDRGLFTVPSVETLNRGQLSFGAGWSNTDRTPRDLDVNAFPVFFSVGLASRLTVTAAFDAAKQVKASNLTQPGFNSSLPFVSRRFSKGYGDAVLSGKFRIWRQRDNVGGMAIKGFVKFPSAKPDKALGTGQADGGAELIFTSQLPWVHALLNSSMGYTATRNSKKPFAITLKDEVRSGLGLAFPSSGINIGASTLQGIFEYTTITYVGASSPNAATTTVQNPADVAAGLRWMLLNSGLTFNAGFRINTKFDREFPNNRERKGLVVGISYTKPVRPIGNNHYPVIALESDSSEISTGGSATITLSAFDADKDPLKYTWSATGGKVEGAGEQVTFRAAGLAPGKYTIRAVAVDGKGGTATSEVEITVKQ